MKRTKGEKIFHFIVMTFFVLLCLSIIFPLLNIIALAFSGKGEVAAGLVSLWPKGFTLDSFKYVFRDGAFITSFFISVSSTIIGTFLSVITVTLAAYPLSKPKLRHRRPILLFFVFTMMFGGGLVPTYIVIKSLGLLDSYWVLILPSIMSVYNMLLVKNFMEGLPESLEESAKIDGASDFQILKAIVIPLCKPVLATVGLFFAVGYWNSYFPGVMYITNPALEPLQTYLYEMLKASMMLQELTPEQLVQMAEASSDSIQSATIIATTIPILIVYPFLQKHFVKGIVVGTEK
ncbi:MAG: carbohydrate ABC transporter permease [Erysipelotrichaceae bacterium]